MNLRSQQIFIHSSYIVYNLKSTNSSVHEHTDCGQTTKIHVNKLNDCKVLLNNIKKVKLSVLLYFSHSNHVREWIYIAPPPLPLILGENELSICGPYIICISLWVLANWTIESGVCVINIDMKIWRASVCYWQSSHVNWQC